MGSLFPVFMQKSWDPGVPSLTPLDMIVFMVEMHSHSYRVRNRIAQPAAFPQAGSGPLLSTKSNGNRAPVMLQARSATCVVNGTAVEATSDAFQQHCTVSIPSLLYETPAVCQFQNAGVRTKHRVCSVESTCCLVLL